MGGAVGLLEAFDKGAGDRVRASGSEVGVNTNGFGFGVVMTDGVGRRWIRGGSYECASLG